MKKPTSAFIAALFFISGFAGLVYELTWTRMLTPIFGSQTYAMTAVLAAYMGGMALGSFFIGRYADRRDDPLLLVAIVEIAIGLTAALTPMVLRLFDGVYPAVYSQTNSSVGLLFLSKLLLSLFVLLVPTFLMGGTLPILCRLFVQRPGDSGQQVGRLYAVNTLGAAVGCFVTGFVFIEMFGVTRSVYVAAAIDALIGIAFFVLHTRYGSAAMSPARGEVSEPAADVDLVPAEQGATSRYLVLILIGFFLSGFVSLSYELLWTRLLVFKLKMTAYAFAIMLTTFLIGLGTGSLIVYAAEKRGLIKNHPRTLGMIQCLIGALGLLTIVLFSRIDAIAAFDVVGFPTVSTVWSRLVFTEMLLAATIMILPTMLMGMTLSLISRIVARRVTLVGRTVGSVYAVNTLGSIVGSCMTGFFFVRALGTHTSIVVISLVSLAIGTAIVLLNRRDDAKALVSRVPAAAFSSIVWIVAAATIVLTPQNVLARYYNIYEEQFTESTALLYASEGIEGITTVHRYPDGTRGLSTSSVNVAGTHYTHRTTQKLQAHVPMLVHPDPKTVCQIGFGSGETSRIVVSYDIDRLDLIEISSDVIDTAARYFGDINGDVVHDPKFNSIIMDGANYVRLADAEYDLILNDASWPGYTGCSALYTQDYFRAASERLKPGGIMTSWFPLGEGDEFRILLKTFHSVFPHVSVWYATTHVNKHVLVLGAMHEIEIDAKAFAERFVRYAQADLESVDLHDPLFFLDLHQMDETTLGRVMDPSIPIHTLDRPVLEFTVKELDAVQNVEALNLMIEGNASIVAHLTNSDRISVEGMGLAEALDRARQATLLVMRGYVRVIGTGEYKPAFESEFKDALVIAPAHPGANHFFFRMLNLHTTMAGRYADGGQREYAASLYDLAAREIEFYLGLWPDAARAHFEKAMVHLNGGVYLGLERAESLEIAREELAAVLALDSALAEDQDIVALIAWVDESLVE